jgi:hemerythrin-like domain-containing protein
MADAIDILMGEHRIIEKVLEALEDAAERDLPPSFYERALDFLAGFADGCHHGKEEERLFPALEQCGIPRAMGPIGVMCDEHVEGRGHVKRMRECLRRDDRDGMRRESVAYAALLRQHIRKEDEILFVMARHVLAPQDARRLSREFEEVDRAARPQEKYGAIADALAAEARRA